MRQHNLDIDHILTEIDNKSKAIINAGDQLSAISPNLHTFDLFLIAALNKTVNLNKAFTTLIRDKNFIAAAPFVRINLDCLMRLRAARIAELDLHNFTLKVMSGKHIRRMKSKTGQPMTDKYLVDEISAIEGMSWVKDVYDNGNSYIHFADTAIFASQTLINHDERTIGLSIGFHDAFIKDDTKLAAVFWMDKIVDQIIYQAQIWMLEKCKAVGLDIEKLNDPDFVKSRTKGTTA